MPPSAPVFVIVVVVYCRTLNCNSTCIILFRTAPCVCVRYTRIPGCVYVCECMRVPVHASTALCGAMCYTRIGEYRHLCAMPLCVLASAECVCAVHALTLVYLLLSLSYVCVRVCGSVSVKQACSKFFWARILRLTSRFRLFLFFFFHFASLLT